MNAGEAQHIVDLAESNGLVALEAMWTRFLPHMIRIRDIIAAGTILEVRIKWWPQPEPPQGPGPPAQRSRTGSTAGPRHLPHLLRVRHPGHAGGGKGQRFNVGDGRGPSNGQSSSSMPTALKPFWTANSTPPAPTGP